ncbi:ATP-dependent RecD-like DNA helicase [Paramuribaculum intestinale]|uniref:ATP-dependent RecD-like DNA helicase n=3 Tax=Muribaculaceae TaxID=2005473 RepID=A0A2V1IVK2_9BACT|nr:MULTISPECIES: ATP-dependent RecD-like DNA helicase [Muribaculaceae]MCX4277758.1 ATP-dependent RecD-like DNA helicase [Muribaculum sp.]PWB06981.1 ATP-dependent RecD-like DNA helicase [Paramuribaculum intestinale]ROS89966.1 ATP-dependent RecD-like DNA helicase [Muribaculaceae bacterium Isolate-043 (Harlan)]
MTKLRGVVEHITYQNPENGWSVMKVKVKDYKDLVTLTGSLLDVPVGSVLLCEGQWKVDARYGQQYVVESWEEVMPATIYGIEKYLGSGLIKGIGPAYARAIVSRFGLEILEVIENDIERLLEVPRLGRKRMEKIRESWEKQKDIKEVMVFLQGYGVSTAYAAKIYRQYQKDAIKTVKENPYKLADDIWGIGFKTADGIASKMGYENNDPRRCRSGILYTLNRLAEEGHVYAEPEQLVTAAKELLQADEEPIRKAIADMIEAKDLIADNDVLYLPPFYHAENGSAKRLTSLLSESLFSDMAAEEAVPYGNQSNNGIVYDEVQQAAIKQALESKVMVLTGGPGTGKTTTTQGIIAAFKSRGMQILLAAPTGRAAKRMTEATGMEAKTIHRLLEYNPMDGYKRNDENPLEGDALIVDECSMIDIMLFYNLMKAIPANMCLILVGDIDQLPSVGAGNVLRDIIDSQRIPVVRLTRIFRQAQTSRIVMNAHAINAGRFPNISNGKDTDFFFIKAEDAEAIPQLIVSLVRDRLSRAYSYNPKEIQVLTPMQRGNVGAGNLNTELQNALNPSGESLTRGGYTFRRGDKVMQIRNNYDKNVFNGDIGYVNAVDTTERTLTVIYDGRLVEYDVSELDELTLAYAVTIHKSQGSEFPVVVIPVTMKHFVMLQRNLIYTGITRAKKICVLVGTTKALAYAIHNQTVSKRNTKLKERLNNNCL